MPDSQCSDKHKVLRNKLAQCAGRCARKNSNILKLHHIFFLIRFFPEDCRQTDCYNSTCYSKMVHQVKKQIVKNHSVSQ